MVSPWLANGNVRSYLKKRPDMDRIMLVGGRLILSGKTLKVLSVYSIR